MFDICVLGSASFDLFLKVNHFPVEGETIQANDSFIKNGGKGANQAVASARLQCKTSFAGQFGADKYGDNLVKEMAQAGISLNFLKRTNEVQTGQAIIMLNDKGENSIIIVGGANIHYASNNLPDEYKEAILQSKMLLLQKEIRIEMTEQAAIFAKLNHKLVMLDCGGRDDLISSALLKNVDFLSPNETELLRLAQDPNILGNQKDKMQELIIQNLLQNYPDLNIVLKLGEKGSCLTNNQIKVSKPSVIEQNNKILEKYSIVDTTGAGDCFTAAFCVRYLEQCEKKMSKSALLEECLQFANSAAFLCITVLGAMPSMPLREKVDKFIEEHLA